MMILTKGKGVSLVVRTPRFKEGVPVVTIYGSSDVEEESPVANEVVLKMEMTDRTSLGLMKTNLVRRRVPIGGV